MKANLKISCYQCGKHLEYITVDTADMPEDVQQRLNLIILQHRKDCPYYRD